MNNKSDDNLEGQEIIINFAADFHNHADDNY